MGKRSNFKRRKHDKYGTPETAMRFVLPFLKPGTRFCEPCAGDARMVRYLLAHGLRCSSAWDIKPGHPNVLRRDARVTRDGRAQIYITNPPWTRDLLHAIIENLGAHRPTWLLFDADWMHTDQAREIIKGCSLVVTVGRLSWMANGTSGKENCCWYLFTPGHTEGPRVVGRRALS